MRKAMLAIAVLVLPSLASAQMDRTGSWEWSVIAIYQDSADSGADGGSALDVDSELGLGFNFTYNFNNNFSLGADFEWVRPDFTATLISDEDPPQTTTINHTLTQFNGRFKGTWNFIDGPLTPYAELGLGWSWFDSNVADGPPITGCWWHPWWGYICSNYYSTFSSTEFTYGGALGLRYTMRGGMFWKFSVNHYVLDAGSGGADPELNAARLEIGWGF
jgi:opacity protein-like surface antigen